MLVIIPELNSYFYSTVSPTSKSLTSIMHRDPATTSDDDLKKRESEIPSTEDISTTANELQNTTSIESTYEEMLRFALNASGESFRNKKQRKQQSQQHNDSSDNSSDDSSKNSKEIITPHKNDVLSGRGAAVSQHEGNEYFHAVIKTHKLRYIKARPSEKKKLIKKIVELIYNQSPPGRFLKKNAKGSWERITLEQARKKTGQALREDAPKLRKMVANMNQFSPGRDASDAAAFLPPLPMKETNNIFDGVLLDNGISHKEQQFNLHQQISRASQPGMAPSFENVLPNNEERLNMHYGTSTATQPGVSPRIDNHYLGNEQQLNMYHGQNISAQEMVGPRLRNNMLNNEHQFNMNHRPSGATRQMISPRMYSYPTEPSIPFRSDYDTNMERGGRPMFPFQSSSQNQFNDDLNSFRCPPSQFMRVTRHIPPADEPFRAAATANAAVERKRSMDSSGSDNSGKKRRY